MAHTRRNIRAVLIFVSACVVSSATTFGLTLTTLDTTESRPDTDPSVQAKELASVYERLASLERRPTLQSKVTVVRERGAERLDGGGPVREDPPFVAGGPSDQEAQAASDEWGRQLAEFVGADRGDHKWGNELVTSLTDLLSTPEFDSMELLESECSSTLCRAVMRINSSDLADRERITADLLISEPFKRTNLFLKKEDGTFEAYLAKRGAPIPMRKTGIVQ